MLSSSNYHTDILKFNCKKELNIIFYPSVAYERKENVTQGNHYNCPVVTSYPEVIRNNVDNLETNEIIFRNPFMDLSKP